MKSTIRNLLPSFIQELQVMIADYVAVLAVEEWLWNTLRQVDGLREVINNDNCCDHRRPGIQFLLQHAENGPLQTGAGSGCRAETAADSPIPIIRANSSDDFAIPVSLLRLGKHWIARNPARPAKIRARITALRWLDC